MGVIAFPDVELGLGTIRFREMQLGALGVSLIFSTCTLGVRRGEDEMEAAPSLLRYCWCT